MANIFNWLVLNWLELFGTVSALVYLYFSIRQSIWLWPLGILASALYIVVYFTSKFYADMGLQVYYLIISVYGWWFWLKGKSNGNSKIKISKCPKNKIIWLFILSIFLWLGLAYILLKYTDTDVPWGDALTTAFSITATYMLARKYIEQWVIWVFVDAISLALYIYKGLNITAFLFLIYTVMAVIGYFKWKKQIDIAV